MTDSSIIGQLYQRKMFRIGAGYLAVAWLLWQVVANTCPTFDCSNESQRTIFWLLLGGLPITLAVAWVNWKTAIIVGVAFIAGAGVAVMMMGSRPLPVVPIAEVAVEPVPQIVEEAVQERLPNSVAVLPFDNLSPDQDNAYFAAGIHESTLNQLAKIRDLTVIARTSVLQYAEDPPPIPEIAKALRVEMVMEGSVRYANDRVLITAQLIDGETGGHVWSDEYNRDLSDIFAVQAEIATQIAAALQAVVLPSEQESIATPPTESREAYEHYLYAISLPHTAVFPEFQSEYDHSLEQAIAADPQFAEAYAFRANGEQDRDVALGYAIKAVELDPTNGIAYGTLGHIYSQYYAQQEAAADAFERGLELNPSEPETLIRYARFLAYHRGEFDKAIRLGQRAVALDPNDFTHRDRLGHVYIAAGDLAAAAESELEAMRVEPGAPSPYVHMARIQMLNGNAEAAREYLRTAVRIWQPAPIWGWARMAYYSLRLGETEQAAKLLTQLEQLSAEIKEAAPGDMAVASLATSDDQHALQVWTELVDSYVDGGRPADEGAIYFFRNNESRDPRLDQPEFVELRKRVGYQD